MAQDTHEPGAGASAQHLAALRQLRFIWMPVETGAPAVDPWEPFGSPDAMDDLAAITGTRDGAALRQFYAETMTLLPRFVAVAAVRLAPGRYVLDKADVEHLQDFMPDADPGVDENGNFGYTTKHMAALPRLNWEVLHATGSVSQDPLKPDQVEPSEAEEEDKDGGRTWPVMAVSVKRPYGDKTGSGSLALHHTVPAALRVVVLHGTEALNTAARASAVAPSRRFSGRLSSQS